MAKTKGQKAIERENARMMRERKKQIEQANRMLIPVPKVTQQSLGLVSFDPTGAFRFADGRWMKCYRVERISIREEFSFAELVMKLHSEIRLTKKLGYGADVTCVTLTLSGETYDEVRTGFMEDEATLNGLLSLTPLNVDMLMSEIAQGKAAFSYASMVRGKKDWKKECLPEYVDKEGYFTTDGLYGECCFVMQFPDILLIDMVDSFKALGSQIQLVVDIKKIDTVDQIDYNRALEQKYNRKLGDSRSEDYLNVSMQLMFLCDSDDAREIIEKTITAVLSKDGFVVAPCVGAQKQTAESISSLGMISRTYMRNVGSGMIDVMLGKEDLWQ